MTGALNPPRPAGWGWESALAHAGTLAVEADGCSQAVVLLQDVSEVYKAHKVNLPTTMKTVLLETLSCIYKEK